MTNIIKDQVFGQERALYNIQNITLINVSFKGEEDGESALKEARNCILENCTFDLRYPLWHVDTYSIKNSFFSANSRAPLWYCLKGNIISCEIKSPKAVRESTNLVIDKSIILSEEFGWKSTDVTLLNSEIESNYLFFDSSKIKLENVMMKGKYSFQYIKDLVITNSNLDTKDAFWHSENVYVKDSVIKGEYLGWYSKNVTLENCVIIGTQPLCYCENLKLINCQMIDTDLAFEYSDVLATIQGDILSIKNPRSGSITCDNVLEIVSDNNIYDSNVSIIERNKKYEKLAS